VPELIEFYIPSTFRKRVKWVPLDQRGKLIEFTPVAKTSACTNGATFCKCLPSQTMHARRFLSYTI
jgi:hypothetical protein